MYVCTCDRCGNKVTKEYNESVKDELYPVQYASEEGGCFQEWPNKKFVLSNSNLPLLLMEESGFGMQYRDIRNNPYVKFRFNRDSVEISVHLIKFTDGRIWDCINGFRKEEKSCATCACYRPKTTFEK